MQRYALFQASLPDGEVLHLRCEGTQEGFL